MECCSFFDLLISHYFRPKASKLVVSDYSRSSWEERLVDDVASEVSVESPRDYSSSPVQEDCIYSSEDQCNSLASTPGINGDTAGHIIKVALNSPFRRGTLDPPLRNVSYGNLGLDASNSHHVWRPRHIKLTWSAVKGEDLSGKRMINNYIKERVINIGNYSKVVLCRNVADEEFYAMKIVRKPRLQKFTIPSSEASCSDIYKEISIMKELDHPNIVKLIEVIDDSDCDRLYMILEYVKGGCILKGPDSTGGIPEATARKYLRDIVTGLRYLHSCGIIHGDIKPENLLINDSGQVKICDFGVSQRFEGNNDELRCSPGTQVFTAPECITGATYHGRAADVWALGVTLYCMIFGQYPFIGDTIKSTFHEIIHRKLNLPKSLNPYLANLLEGLLCKDPIKRLTLEQVTQHQFYKESS
ncbi:hypothetical protein KP509_07G049400 [Ceratopteris richardii]|uniref:Protein kinase domain-containing protein n=2 Tax=Ceratopteris richardii TaxID=49495 RepID=A0A8T2UHM5_CERRI|nr:hypothetical protein KP509_07G049400 [Ceratopteris richardii]